MRGGKGLRGVVYFNICRAQKLEISKCVDELAVRRHELPRGVPFLRTWSMAYASMLHSIGAHSDQHRATHSLLKQCRPS
jgi:hypothetical protein